VLGNVELALQDLSPLSPVRDNLKEIEKTSRRAAELCRQMLAYSGRGRFVVQALDLRELVTEMGQMLEVSISKKVLLRYVFAPDIPPIEADPTQIRQVLMNTIINASEAIGAESGVITVSVGVQECSLAHLESEFVQPGLPAGPYVSLEITDTGCGMDEATRSRIFEPFFTTKFTGRGLGLAAVLGIVRGHKGAIKIYSEKGKGTTFRILFPAIGRAADHLAGPADGSVAWKGAGLILFADDEDPVRKVGQSMLERMGFRVILAVDGRDAIDRFSEEESAHPGAISCVLLDLTMPHKNGEEVFKEIRKVRPDIPVILSSGFNEQEVTQKFVGKGLAGFIQKPYQMHELAAKVRAAVQPAGDGPSVSCG
jgi:CheY-like chemotaxis protein